MAKVIVRTAPYGLRAMKRRLAEYQAKAADLERRITQLETVGWRAVCNGDEYDYGGYANYLFSDVGRKAKAMAEACVAESKRGGFVEPILRGREIPKYRIH